MLDTPVQPRETVDPNSAETPTIAPTIYNSIPIQATPPNQTTPTSSRYQELESLQQQTIHGYALTRNSAEAYGDTFGVKPKQTF